MARLSKSQEISLETSVPCSLVYAWAQPLNFCYVNSKLPMLHSIFDVTDHRRTFIHQVKTVSQKLPLLLVAFIYKSSEHVHMFVWGMLTFANSDRFNDNMDLMWTLQFNENNS